MVDIGRGCWPSTFVYKNNWLGCSRAPKWCFDPTRLDFQSLEVHEIKGKTGGNREHRMPKRKTYAGL